MKRFSLCLCLSVVNVLLAAAQQLPQQPPAPVHPKPGAHVVSITETSFSGMCYGYCVLETRAKPGKVEVLQYAFREQKNAYPGKKKKKGKLTPAEWRELEAPASDQALVDLP